MCEDIELPRVIAMSMSDNVALLMEHTKLSPSSRGILLCRKTMFKNTIGVYFSDIKPLAALRALVVAASRGADTIVCSAPIDTLKRVGMCVYEEMYGQFQHIYLVPFEGVDK